MFVVEAMQFGLVPIVTNVGEIERHVLMVKIVLSMKVFRKHLIRFLN